jgi:CIC family chloride channel protein
LVKDLLILKPILVACLTSFLIARLFSPHSIYERQMSMEAADEKANKSPNQSKKFQANKQN